MLGNAATNVLNGAAGSDTLTGFNGKDVFVFNTALNATTNLDRITDFSVVDDFMRLENGIFAGLATGALAATAFRIGAPPRDVEDRIIYNAATGTLIYDSMAAPPEVPCSSRRWRRTLRSPTRTLS